VREKTTLGKKQLLLRTPAPLMDRLAVRAQEEGLSKNELATKALQLYLTKDITDESLFIAKLSELQRIVQILDKKIDTAQKLQIEWFQYFFLFQPDEPQDEGERRRLVQKAAERTEELLANFRRRLPHLPAFLEALLSDYLEEEEKEK
jgi:hypothetical protein